MAPEPDDDALRWDGDDDPTLAPGWKVVGAPAVSDAAPGTSADGAQAEAGADEASDRDERRQAGSVELVVLGILGGVYLLYTVGWLLTVVRTDAPGTSIVGDFMYVLGLWLAVLAPALWFGLVFASTSKAAVRLVWLAVGAVVLAPLPFVLGVAA
ncbi:DNA polymerase III subunit gamma/tau [Agromyces sp. MMS24-K17]|uniref:DNA polymerase III subunit gamma/tau n=1 Tax=Agromyces sp. MMS24-K17 TaxID=3372850 RepID=UPI003754E62F